jgi:hypothetical protein
MNTPLSISDPRREYILAEFRCAWTKAKLAQQDIEAVGLALQASLMTVEEAVAMFWDSEAVRFLGLQIGEVSR